MEVAENVARSMLHNQMICEYGIVHLNPYNKIWKHILVEAKEYAKLEWDKIKDYSDSYYKHEANQLLKIINGEYC